MKYWYKTVQNIGGYCSDTKFKFEEKLAEKTVQHGRLMAILQTCRYDVWLGPITLGYAGTIYTNNLSVLQELGLNRSATKTVLKRLQLLAISCLRTRAEQVSNKDCAEKTAFARHKLPTLRYKREKVLGTQL